MHEYTYLCYNTTMNNRNITILMYFRLQLVAIPETNDSRSKMYREYIERAKELATTKWPKNNLRKVSFANTCGGYGAV